MPLTNDPATLVPWMLTSVVAALIFVFTLYIKVQGTAYNEMKSTCDSRYKDMKEERDRSLAAQELTNQNIVAVLAVIKIGVEGTGASMQAQVTAMQAQTAAMLVIQRLLERTRDDPRDRR